MNKEDQEREDAFARALLAFQQQLREKGRWPMHSSLADMADEFKERRKDEQLGQMFARGNAK